jgi:hypothetical protein
VTRRAIARPSSSTKDVIRYLEQQGLGERFYYTHIDNDS